MSSITASDSPTDPAAAALDMILRVPLEFFDEGDPGPLTAVLQDYCGLLDAEGIFDGLPWHDAKYIAAAVGFDVCARGDDAADSLRSRATRALCGTDGMTWADKTAAARAFNVSARMLGA